MRASIADRIAKLFQSTPACERATALVSSPTTWSTCFNPRPRVSGRPRYSPPPIATRSFQSTPACERATVGIFEDADAVVVSIHARV